MRRASSFCKIYTNVTLPDGSVTFNTKDLSLTLHLRGKDVVFQSDEMMKIYKRELKIWKNERNRLIQLENQFFRLVKKFHEKDPKVTHLSIDICRQKIKMQKVRDAKTLLQDIVRRIMEEDEVVRGYIKEHSSLLVLN